MNVIAGILYSPGASRVASAEMPADVPLWVKCILALEAIGCGIALAWMLFELCRDLFTPNDDGTDPVEFEQDDVEGPLT